MFGTKSHLVDELRSMALAGRKPSEMLRMLMPELTEHEVLGMVDRNVLVQHFSEAFCFGDGEAYCIFGWLPDGTGELKDENIDFLLTKRVEKTRTQWDEEV